MENVLWFNGLTMKTIVANKALNIKILDDESVTSTTLPKSFQNIVLAEINKVFENAKEQNTNGSNPSANMPVCVSVGVQTVECESGFNKRVTDINSGNLSTSRVSAETQTDTCLPIGSNGIDSIASQTNSCRLLAEKQTWLER